MDKKTGSVFWSGSDCGDCFMPRIIMYPGDGATPKVLEHCECRVMEKEHDNN